MSKCPQCGVEFYCSVKDGDGATCWCMNLPSLAKESLKPDKGCLCPACLERETSVVPDISGLPPKPWSLSFPLAVAVMIVIAVSVSIVTRSKNEMPSRTEIEASIRANIIGLAGKEGIECGLVPLGGDPEQSFACARNADSKKEPFWIAVQMRGEDSIVWLAAILKPDGSRLLSLYDSNPMGAPELNPHIDSRTCRAFAFEPKGDEPIDCLD